MRLQDRQDLGALIVGLLIPDMEKDGIIPKNFNWKKITKEEAEKIREYVTRKIDEVKDVRK